PVPDESAAITRLFAAGWAAAPGSRFRIGSPPGIRLTISDLAAAEIGPLADAIADSLGGTGTVSV
ncbi:MAG: GntR family transcriptional regulator, partial [Actinomycetota bacterium]|nr:GntR family transcriptional regulator [Actinomycetota bacterium]